MRSRNVPNATSIVTGLATPMALRVVSHNVKAVTSDPGWFDGKPGPAVRTRPRRLRPGRRGMAGSTRASNSPQAAFDSGDFSWRATFWINAVVTRRDHAAARTCIGTWEQLAYGAENETGATIPARRNRIACGQLRHRYHAPQCRCSIS